MRHDAGLANAGLDVEPGKRALSVPDLRVRIADKTRKRHDLTAISD